MRLSREWITHVFFTLMEHGLVRILDASTTLVLIRILGSVHFGIFSIYQSWVAVILLALPYVELSLYRDYGTLKANDELGLQLAVFRKYNVFKLAFAIVFMLGLAIFDKGDVYVVQLSLLGFALALPLSQSFYGPMRDPLRFERKQHMVAMISAAQKICLIGAMVVAFKFAPGNVPILFAGALAVYFTYLVVWGRASRSVVPHAPVSMREFGSRLYKTMSGTAIWIHVNGVITGAVLTLDIFALNLAHHDVEEIGRYSVALKAANFFQLIPMAVVNSFGVYLGKHQHEKNHKKERRIMWLLSLGFLVTCMAMFKLGFKFGMPILDFIGKHKIQGEEYTRTLQYYYWQLLSLMLMASSFPLSTYLGARASLKKITLQVFLPWIAISLAVYYAAARTSMLFTARANVITYGVLVGLLVLLYFTQRKTIEAEEARG